MIRPLKYYFCSFPNSTCICLLPHTSVTSKSSRLFRISIKPLIQNCQLLYHHMKRRFLYKCSPLPILYSILPYIVQVIFKQINHIYKRGWKLGLIEIPTKKKTNLIQITFRSMRRYLYTYIFFCLYNTKEIKFYFLQQRT